MVSMERVKVEPLIVRSKISCCWRFWWPVRSGDRRSGPPPTLDRPRPRDAAPLTFDNSSSTYSGTLPLCLLWSQPFYQKYLPWRTTTFPLSLKLPAKNSTRYEAPYIVARLHELTASQDAEIERTPSRYLFRTLLCERTELTEF